MRKKYLYPMVYIGTIFGSTIITKSIVSTLLYMNDLSGNVHTVVFLVSRLVSLLIPICVLLIVKSCQKQYRLIQYLVILSVIDNVANILFFSMGLLFGSEISWLPFAYLMVFLNSIIGLLGFILLLAIIIPRSYHPWIRIGFGVILISHSVHFIFFNRTIVYLTRFTLFDSFSISSVSPASTVFQLLKVIGFAFVLFTIFREQEKKQL